VGPGARNEIGHGAGEVKKNPHAGSSTKLSSSPNFGGRISIPLFGKEGPGEISVIRVRFHICGKIPLSPPFQKKGEYDFPSFFKRKVRMDSKSPLIPLLLKGEVLFSPFLKGSLRGFPFLLVWTKRKERFLMEPVLSPSTTLRTG